MEPTRSNPTDKTQAPREPAESQSASAKRPYSPPSIESEEVLEAGLGTTCNGSSTGGRKVDATGGCRTGKFKT